MARDETSGWAPDIVTRLRTLVDRGWRLSLVPGPASAADDPDMTRGFEIPLEEMWPATFNRAWRVTAVAHGLFSDGERFLIALDPGVDPDLFRAREESGGWRNPR